ncbi:hypothetical protein [Alteribacillus bidgolensis]|uniref:Uncharacterized protein n=1 Tax=Alteribacillus bidgolensis TaxID=930129 RepID=A0A1G8ESV8_9BACI|nr:hypothetical protein [Alteribacillus bidgolensis]SDH72982.1 hypothetical protein SAMN05216352_102366 [Alteribacillus bidgolensis]
MCPCSRPVIKNTASKNGDIASQASMAEKEIVPLELGAVQKAQHILASETPEGQSFHYHYVGYSSSLTI